MTWQWVLIEGECTGCGICSDVCPEGAISHSVQNAYPVSIENRCTGCGVCEYECPFAAIVVRQERQVENST